MTRVLAILSDLDGVVRRGRTPVPGALEGLRRTGLPVRYVTNNASRTPAQVATELGGMGAACRPDDVVTSGLVAAADTVERVGAGSPVMVVGAPALVEAVGGARLVPAGRGPGSPAPVAVVQGWGARVSAQDLAEASLAVRGGALWVATNLDRTLPTDRGPVPGNGMLVEAVAMTLGRRPDVVSGKPGPGVYRCALGSLGVRPDQALAVGDRLDTDVAGARAAGVRAVLVLSGTCDLDDALDAAPAQRPDVVLPDLRWLPAFLESGHAVERLSEAVHLVHALRDAGEGAAAARREAHDVLDRLRCAAGGPSTLDPPTGRRRRR